MSKRTESTLDVDLVPLNISSDKLGQFGEGFAIYFGLLKLLCWTFFFLSIIHIPMAYVNYVYGSRPIQTVSVAGESTTYTTKPILFSSFIHLDPIDDKYLIQITFLGNLLSIIVMLCAFLFYVFKVKDSDDVRGSKHVLAPADFSVQISRLPKDVLDPQEYVAHFSSFGHVCNVALGYNHGSITSLYEKSKLITAEIKACNAEEELDRRDSSCGASFRRIVRKIFTPIIFMARKLSLVRDSKFWIAKQKKILEEIEDLKNSDYYPVRCFLSFNTVHQKENCLAAYRHPKNLLVRFFRSIPLIRRCFFPKSLKFHKKRIKVKECPNPSDILWSNLHISRIRRAVAEGATLAVMSVFILLSFAIVVFFEIFSSTFSVTQSIMSSFTVIIINRALYTSSFVFTEKERHTTYSKSESSLFSKLFLFQIVNSAFVVMIVSSFRTGSPIYEWSSDFYLESMSQVFLILLGDVVINNILRVFSPVTVAKKIFGTSSTYSSQERMDEAMAGSDFHLAECYSNTFKTLYMVLIYLTALPAAAPLGFLYFLISYWSDKYRLLRICKAAPSLNNEMAKHIPRILLFSIIFRCIFSYAAIISIVPNSNAMAETFLIIGALIFVLFTLFVHIPQLRQIMCFPLIFGSCLGHSLRSIFCQPPPIAPETEYLSFKVPQTYVPPLVPPTVHARFGTVLFSRLKGVNTKRSVDLVNNKQDRDEELALVGEFRDIDDGGPITPVVVRGPNHSPYEVDI